MKHIRSLILASALFASLAPAFAQAPPPVPALPDSERRTSYSISASTCACAVGFQLYQDSTDYANWLKVYINGVEIPQSGNWNITSPSGSIATLPRPITNAVLTFTAPQTGTVQIVGAQRPRRLSEYAENRGVAARDLNQAINGIEAQLREMWDRQFRIAQAPPGETLSLLPPLASRANMGACFNSGGNLAPCVSAASGTFIAGTGVTFTGTNPTTISSATYSAGNGITFTGSNPTVVSANANLSIPLIPTRAVAAAQDLSAYTVVKTAGYATAGDGGGAVFRKTSGTLKDTYITAATIAGGSGYANSTYDNVPLTGGSSNGCNARVITSGGAVTQVLISIPCGGYAVGDVLNTTNSFIGNGTGFTYTITTMSTPQGSFTDTAGNKWQITVDEGGVPNVRQYGAKLDWNGVDASATNDRPAYMSAIAQAAIPFTTAAAIVSGNTILVPRGNSLICGGANGAVLPIPKGVVLRGVGVYGGSVLKFCTAESSSNHLIQLCDIYVVSGEFGCAVKDLAILADGPSNANIAAIYSISAQQFPLIDNVYIQPGVRGCVFYDFGKGGAANAIFQNFDCENDTAITNASFVVGSNVGGTQVILENAVFGCAPTLCTHTAVSVSGGAEFHMAKVHIEGTSNGILVQNTGPSSFSRINMVSPCTTMITLSAANPNGIATFEQINGASCTTTVSNGHGGGASITGANIYLQRVFSP